MSAIPPVTAADPEAKSADPVAANLDALKALFPDAFTEGRIDFEVLKQLLGGAIDDGDEKYGLNWSGKRQARRIALTPSMGTLLPAPDDSVDWDTTRNLMIEGDNLEVLKLLQKSYAGKVKLIYIDPPYNTGNDFVYPDDYADSLGNYLRRTGQVDEEGVRNTTNPESSGRYHTEWLNMMLPRLMLARSLLRSDGAIFISADDNEIHNLRLVMDDIFGAERFVAIIAAVTNLKGRNDKRHIAAAHEYLLLYEGENFASRGFALTREQRAAFDQLDEKNRPYALRDLRKRGGPDRRQDRPKMHFPIFWDEKTGVCALERRSPDDIEILPKRGDDSDGVWRWGFETVQRHLPWLKAKRSTRTGRLDVAYRVYLDAAVKLDDQTLEEEVDDNEDDVVERSSKPKSIWLGGDLSSDSGKRSLKDLLPSGAFDFPKSVDLIRNTVMMSSSENDIILDFFAGSGTTGQAVMAQNAIDGASRRYILVQLPEALDPANKDQKAAAEVCDALGRPRSIAELTKERLRLAGAKIQAEHPLLNADVGFRVYKLASSNLKAWQPGTDLETDLLSAADNLVQGRTEDDLLVELLLKQGIDLAEPALTRTIAGRAVHAFGGGVLVVCLGAVTAADAEALADGIADWITALKPAAATTIFFKDAGFENDQAKTNVDAILRQRLDEQLLKVRSV